MRLLKCPITPPQPSTTLPIEAEEYFEDFKPPYAILSHTWGTKNDELTLQELLNPFPHTHAKGGFHKVQKTCEIALTRDKLNHSWVDTCCINKSSSAELDEAIRSMYAWYAEAEVCYVYLSDLPPRAPESSGEDDLGADMLRECRWFTRGWTLQELIAPRDVVFFDREWNERGSKKGLSAVISEITGIPESLLRQSTSLDEYSAACRMSWASSRKTTRIEDAAYCLLGIFNVNISLIYGEGMKAFARLQEAILGATADMSIFLWTDDAAAAREFAPLLADSPTQFKGCGDIKVLLEDTIYRDLTFSTRGIKNQASLIYLPEEKGRACVCVLDVGCHRGRSLVGIGLRKISGGRYARFNTGVVAEIAKYRTSGLAPREDVRRGLVETLHLVTSFPPRFPYHPTNPVLGNRYSVLRFRWCDPASPFRFSAHRARPMPMSHWDVHDQLFFSSNIRSRSWAGLFVHGRLHADCLPDKFIPLNLFICVYLWNMHQPVVYLCGLHDIKPERSMSLEDQLDKILFENCLQSIGVLLSVMDGSVVEDATVIETGVVEQASADEAMPKTPGGRFGYGEVKAGDVDTARAGWHSKLRYCGEKVLVKVSGDVSRNDLDRTVCVTDCVYQLNVRFEVLGKVPGLTQEIVKVGH
ncbi:vegetative incompatibility protein HET-E-1 [Cladorrhinum sp. PSN332]|nr:vegetative incompatibility protein HET-E-1 [Cladorrhinum sp. PSN332]